MSRYKAYPEYENSRIEWADRTPKHWDAVHLRWIAKIYAGGTPSKAIEEYWKNGSVPWINSGEVNQGLICEVSTYITEVAYKNSSAKWIPKNALVMALAGQGKTKGMIAQLAIDATCNQSMAAIVPHDLQGSRYFFWWLHSNYQNIRNMAGGDLRDGLNLELLGNIACPIPGKEEQKSIAAFLDHETAKIDALIEKQQRLIALLKEKRQAVISHAVTKGLNPNAQMKDSGVEWLGEVPAHWVVARYKFCTTRVIVGIAEAATHAYAESGVPIIRSTDIQEDGLNQDGMLFIKKDFAEQNPSKYLYKNDVVTVRTGYPGTSAVVPEGLNQSHCFTNLVATPRAEHHSQFLVEYLNSYIGKKYFELNAWGSAQKNISVPILQDFPIAFPEREEEEKIVQYVSLQKQEFSKLIALAESSTGLMQERRTALISAAVTGKIDVRDWQAAA